MASRAQPALWRETVKAGAVRSGALIAAIALFVGTLLMALALASYHPSDPALNTASGGDPANRQAHTLASGQAPHRGARAVQTRAPSSMTATFQTRATSGSAGTSVAARAVSARVSAAAGRAAPVTARASTRRTLVSTTTVRSPCAKHATAAAV